MAEQKVEQIQPVDGGGYNEGNMYGNPIIKQGELQKKGTGITSALSWKVRYFILRADGEFSYYKTKNSKEKIKSIDLRKIYKVERDRKDKRYLYLQTKERKWDLFSDKISELDEWEKLLRKASTKEDYIEFRIQNAECSPVICNNILYGFIGEGLPIQVTSKVSVFSEITFCSFIYPKEEKTIKIDSNTLQFILNGEKQCFKLNTTHNYQRKLETKSVRECTVLSNALMQKQEDAVKRMHNFVDYGEEKKINYNENDIFINMDLQCNFIMTAEHAIAMNGAIKKGIFGKSDNRIIDGSIGACLTAYVQPKYDILNKNDNNTREQWWIYRNRIMDDAFERKRVEFENRIDELVLKGKGNQINLLPFYMKQKIPMKEYELKPIWNRILNKKFLCHQEAVMINKCGEIMNKNIYIMADLQFDKEEIYEHPPQLCDTLYVGPKGRILKHPRFKITDIFQFEQFYGQNVQYGTFNGFINHNGKQIIKNKWYLHHDNRVKIVITRVQIQSNEHKQNEHKQNKHNAIHKRVAEIKIYAKKKETRYYYKVNACVSYVNDVIEPLPSDYKDDCVIL
eukprot:435681_1